MDTNPPESWSEKGKVPGVVYIALLFFGLFAVFCVYSSYRVVFAYNDSSALVISAALLPFPAGVLLFLYRNYICNAVALTTSLRDIAAYRESEVGLYFANSRIIPVSQFLMAVGLFPIFLFFTVASFQTNESTGIIFAILILLFSLFIGMVLISSAYRILFPGGVRVDAHGIWYTSLLVDDFEEWDNIAAIYPLKFSRAVIAIVRYENSQSNLRRSRLTFINSLEKELSPWFVIVTNNLVGSPILPLRVIQFYLENPHFRLELSSKAALKRFRATADDA